MIDIQREVCREYGAEYIEVRADLKVGVAANVRSGLLPINGLRHPPTATTTGWYIWAGDELSQEPNFFLPLHLAHLSDWCPDSLKFLGLPPGWRFLTDGNYSDVWFDPALLQC